MPTLLEAPPEANPFADLIGGDNGGPAYQTVAGRFSEVPKASVATPTDLGAFADMVPGPGRDVEMPAVEQDLGIFQALVPQSPTSESEKALAEVPKPPDPGWTKFEKGIENVTGQPFHHIANTIRVLGQSAGHYIFDGMMALERNRAALEHPKPGTGDTGEFGTHPAHADDAEAGHIVLPDGSFMSDQEQQAFEQQYQANLEQKAHEAMSGVDELKKRRDTADANTPIDPALARTVPARLAAAAGPVAVMTGESMIPGVGLPLMVMHGALATEQEALDAGATPEQAQRASVRSAIGLAIFGGFSKFAAAAVAKALPVLVKDPSQLTRFIAQFTGQEAANETSSRVISAWNAAADAPEGQKVQAATAAATETNLENTVMNSMYALAHAAKASRGPRMAPEAPRMPASEPEPAPVTTPGVAPETARYVEPAREATGVRERQPQSAAERQADFERMSANLNELNRDQFLPDRGQETIPSEPAAPSRSQPEPTASAPNAASRISPERELLARMGRPPPTSGLRSGLITKRMGEFYRDRAGVIDAGKFTNSVADDVKKALKHGQKVELVTDLHINQPKVIPIVDVRRGSLIDGKNQPWGALDVLTGASEIKIGEAPLPLKQPLKVESGGHVLGITAPGTAELQAAGIHLGKIWKQVRDVPKFNDFRRSILKFGSRMQRSVLEAKEIQRNLKRAVPNKVAREGIFNLVEAGGDMSKLEAWRDATTDPKLKRGYQAALDLTPEQHDIATHLSDFYSAKLSEAQASGIVAEGRENYINRIVDKRRSKGFSEASPGAPGSSGRLSRNFKHGLHRVYESAFDAEQNGIRYQSKDIAELAPIYLNEMNKTIGTRELVENLTHGRAEDGRALAYPKGMMREVKDAAGDTQARVVKPNFKQQVLDERTGEDVSSQDYQSVDHPALSGHKWLGEAEGKPILMQGDLALHPDIAQHVRNIVGQSALRKWYNSEGSPLMSIPKGIVRNIDKSQQLAKSLLFSGSGFHHANIGFHAVEHRVNPLPEFFKALSRDYTIDPASPAVKDGMAHGLQLAPDQLSAQSFMEGFAGGGIEKIPLYGKFAKAISDHLFERFIPQLKLRLYDSILERNMKRYVGEMARNEITPDQVKYLSATQANSALSHLNYLDLGHNPTMRHIFSLTTMAPDFTESRVRFLSQAAKGLTGSKAGREQLEALVYGAGLIWSMARVMNKVVDDDWHFEEPFGVVHNGRRYAFRSIQGDIAHAITDTRKFIYGRISPLGKLFTEQFLTGTNYRGEKISHGESLKEYLANYVPITGKNIPGVRDLFETTRNNPVTPWESFLGAIGVQVSRYSPIQKVYKMADDWKTEQGVPKDKGTYPISKYQQLRYSLEDGDFDRAEVEYQKLVESGMKPSKINAGFKESIHHSWTGSQSSDLKFKNSLGAKDRELYEMAVKRRHEILRRFQSMPKR